LSNLTQRILVALVAIPVIVFCCLVGGFAFFALIALISSLALYEYYMLATRKGAAPQTVVGLIVGVLVCCAFLWQRLRAVAVSFGIELPEASSAQLVMTLLLLATLLVLLIELFRKKDSALMNMATTLFGILYVSLFLGSLIGVREMFPVEEYGRGGMLVVTLFVSLWVCDSLAFFAGRLIGKHKMFVRISPHKTWEGACAGFIGAVLVFVVAQRYFLPFLTPANAFICGSLVGVVGQAGDLAESLLKRDSGVKDSSALIPGHGGALDRFDSLIVISPVFFLYVRLVV
jgi:phosphatidate cytidylyltransferase